MNAKFPPIARRGTLLFGLVLASLLLYNCSSKDLEFIDPYEFVNEDFEDLELVPVADPEPPAFEAPETGAVEASEETLAIIQDILGAANATEISAETVEALAAVDAFAATLPAEVVTFAENLDATSIAAILDPNAELDPALLDLPALLSQVSAELQQLLPEIVLESSVEQHIAFAKQKQFIIDLEHNMEVAQALFGPCVDAANEAYSAAVAELEIQRDTNIDTFITNYERRLLEADTRYDERLALFITDFQTNAAAIEATLLELLAAADHAESIGEAEVAEDIRILALLYAVDGRVKLAEWELAVLELLATTREEEKAVVLEIRNDLTAEVNANYTAKVAEADALLQTALGNCHNQGAGN